MPQAGAVTIAGIRLPAGYERWAEREFQSWITRSARKVGWTVSHTYRAQLKDGTWRTTTTLPGWPDLTLIRPGALMFFEVKGPTGSASPEQIDTLALLASVPGVIAAVVRPSEAPAVAKLLGSVGR